MKEGPTSAKRTEDRGEPKSRTNSIVELIVIVLVAIGLALAQTGFRRQAYRIRQWFDGTDLESRSKSACGPHRHALQRTACGRDPGVHPPKDAEQQISGPRPHMVTPGGAACTTPEPEEASVNFIKRVVAGPGDEIYVKEGHVFRKAAGTSQFVREERLLHRPVRQCLGVQFPQADQDSRRSLVHDGGQSWRVGRQQILGTGPHKLDHRRGFRHLLTSRPHRHPLSAKLSRLLTPGGLLVVVHEQKRTTPIRLRRALGVRMVAGADEAGRGCLVGPLVARRSCRLRGARRPVSCVLSATLNDSKNTKRRLRGALSAACSSTAGARHRRLALCARGSTARPAQDESGGPARCHQGRDARRPGEVMCLIDGFARARVRATAATGRGRHATSAAIRPPRPSGQGHARSLHGSCRQLDPAGTFRARRRLNAWCTRKAIGARSLAATPHVVQSTAYRSWRSEVLFQPKRSSAIRRDSRASNT